jgi:putative colanic acid biosynthesis UDP-glucose lipid carrier transferase
MIPKQTSEASWAQPASTTIVGRNSSISYPSSCDGAPTQPAAPRRRAVILYGWIPHTIACIDLIIILVSAGLSGFLYEYFAHGTLDEITRTLAVSAFVAFFFIFMTKLRNLYNPVRVLLWNDQFQHVLVTWSFIFIFLGGLIFSLGASRDASRGALLWFSLSGGLVLLANRLFWRVFLERAMDKGAIGGRKIIVVIVGLDVSSASEFIACSRHHGLDVMREFHMPNTSPARKEILANIASFVRGADIEEVFLLCRDSSAIDHIVEYLRVLPVPVTLIAQGVTAELVRQPWREIGNSVAIELQRPPLTPFERGCKRAVDIIAAGCGLIILMPLLMLVAAAIKIDSSGPIFFRQTRQGFNGKAFKIFKFRSMSVLEDGATIVQATVNDCRVTHFGAIIRRSSIDEIPQLINVLRGEMSMVGPRPHAIAHDDYFSERIGNYAFRHHVKPGITGWAQIHGFRGETRTLDKMEQRVEYDLWYINNWSLWLDLEIILRTFAEVFKGENAS